MTSEGRLCEAPDAEYPLAETFPDFATLLVYISASGW